mgnify:CR=1 FL=1
MAGIFLKHFLERYRYYIVILLGIIAGALLANLVIDNITDKIGIFNNEFKNEIMNVNLDRILYLKYILKLRLKEYLCLMLVTFTPAAMVGIYFLMLYVGISCGLMISVCVMNMGIKGMFIYAVSLMPQYIIYAITVFFIVSYIEKRQFNMKKTVIMIVISFAFLIMGALYEAYISPVLIRGLFEHISYCI